MSVRLLALCWLTLLLVTSCGSAADVVAPTTSPKQTPAPPTTAQHRLSGVDTGLPKIVGEVPRFSSPSGNIGCEIGEDGARCDIGEYSAEPPPRPKGCQGTGSWGGSLLVDADAAAYVCKGGSSLGADRVLKYGTSTVIGDFGCRSSRDGVMCLDLTTDHGFMVSRDRIGTF